MYFIYCLPANLQIFFLFVKHIKAEIKPVIALLKCPKYIYIYMYIRIKNTLKCYYYTI